MENTFASRVFRVGSGGRVISSEYLEHVGQCQSCESSKIISLKSDGKVDFITQIKGELLNYGELPVELSQFDEDGELFLVICLECGQLQGVWPRADHGEPAPEKPQLRDEEGRFADPDNCKTVELDAAVAETLKEQGLITLGKPTAEGAGGWDLTEKGEAILQRLVEGAGMTLTAFEKVTKELTGFGRHPVTPRWIANKTGIDIEAVRHVLDELIAAGAAGQIHTGAYYLKSPPKAKGAKLPRGAYLENPADPTCATYTLPSNPFWSLEQHNKVMPTKHRIELDEAQYRLLLNVLTTSGDPTRIASALGWAAESVFEAAREMVGFFDIRGDVLIQPTDLARAVYIQHPIPEPAAKEEKKEEPPPTPDVPGSYEINGKLIHPTDPAWRFYYYRASLPDDDQFGIDKCLIDGLGRMGAGLSTADEIAESFSRQPDEKDTIIESLLKDRLIAEYAGRYMVSDLGSAILSQWYGGGIPVIAKAPSANKSDPAPLDRQHLATLGCFKDGGVWMSKGIAKKLGTEEEETQDFLAVLESRGLVQKLKRGFWEITDAGKDELTENPHPTAESKPQPKPTLLALDKLKPREKAALKALSIVAKHMAHKYLKVSEILRSSRHGSTTLRKALKTLADVPIGRRFLVKCKFEKGSAYYALSNTGVRAARELIG